MDNVHYGAKPQVLYISSLVCPSPPRDVLLRRAVFVRLDGTCERPFVLPEATDVEVNIDEKDLRVDTLRSSGAGGQHINKTESCIRLTHIPTGIVVLCQDERSQTKNREKAMKVLKSRLYDYYKSQADKEYADNRRSQVGTGDRSERIRTYNFPDGRVTDHRIKLTLYSIDNFMMGDLDEMIEALNIADRESRLAAGFDDEE